MNTNEYFSDMILKGKQSLLIHSQMSNYYGFLGLKRHQQIHNFLYWLETKRLMSINEYYLTKYNVPIEEKEISNPNVLPENWTNFESVEESKIFDVTKEGFAIMESWDDLRISSLRNLYISLIDKDLQDSDFVKKILIEVEEEKRGMKDRYFSDSHLDYYISVLLDDQSKIFDLGKNN